MNLYALEHHVEIRLAEARAASAAASAAASLRANRRPVAWFGALLAALRKLIPVALSRHAAEGEARQRQRGREVTLPR